MKKHHPILLLVFYFLLNALLCSHAFGKIYKWKDESGELHFSQRMPKNKAMKNIDISDMKRHKIAPVQQRDNGYYCGDMHVLSIYRKPLLVEILRQGPKKIKNYKRSLKDLERRFIKRGTNIYKRYIDYDSHRETQERSKKQIGEYRCAIHWLETQTDLALTKKNRSTEDVEQNLSRIINEIGRRCGVEPPKGALRDEVKIHNKWETCKKKYSGRYRELRKELESLKYKH